MEAIFLNLVPNGIMPICHASQYDKGREIRCNLREGSTAYTIKNGDAVTLKLRKPDNTVVTASITATPGNTYVVFATTEQMCAVVGKNLCELNIKNGSTEIGTMNFQMEVERDPIADGDPSESEIHDLDELVIEAVGDNYYTKGATDTLLNAKANSSDVYTKSQLYNKTETDGLLANKANSSDVYTKSATDTLLDTKANASDVYTKSATDTLLEGKANTEGEYDTLTVGNAKQLVATVGEVDKVPYLFRTAGGTLDIGDRETDELVGGSVAFNQQVSGFWGNGATATTNPDGSIVVTSTGETTFFGLTIRTTNDNVKGIIGHKYFCCVDILSSSISNLLFFGLGNWSASQYNTYSESSGKYQKILEATSNASSYFNAYTNGTSLATDTFTIKNLQIIDLTAMFGATIADYIYNLESANAGAGVAWFKRLFNKPYYSYNSGELMSVKTTAHKMVGKNMISDTFASGLPSTTIGADYDTITTSTRYAYLNLHSIDGNVTVSVRDYDPNYVDWVVLFCYVGKKLVEMKNCNTFAGQTFNLTGFTEVRMVIGAIGGYIVPSAISTVGKIQLEIGSQATAYEPYIEHNYALDDVELRGLFKLDSNNKLYADGDTYESSGDVTRKYGIVDLDSFNYTLYDWGFIADTSISDIIAPANDNTEFVGLSETYHIVTANRVFAKVEDMTIAVRANGRICIHDTNTLSMTNAQFKAYLSGKKLLYLATPTTEQADPFTNPQQVDANGTEEYIDNRAVPIPVGHNTFYMVNLRAKLEMSPDSPENNGDYLMRHTSEGNSYTPYVSPIPALPSTNGNYVLKCTVSGSTKTLTWVEQT